MQKQVRMRICRECNWHFHPKDAVFCSLCRRWFCLKCYRDWHWWHCPKNAK